MKTITVVGVPRTDKGKSAAEKLRSTGFIPCELYGDSGNVHFAVFEPHLKPILYTPEVFKIQLVIEDTGIYESLLKEAQFHPVNEMPLHVDFHQINENRPVKIELPIKLVGTPAGVLAGGKLVKNLRKLKVKGLVQNLPEAIEVNIDKLELGKSIKVKEAKVENFEILNPPSIPIASVEVPRALRGKQAEAAK
jgi:large subunit ribosomal protein L25